MGEKQEVATIQEALCILTVHNLTLYCCESEKKSGCKIQAENEALTLIKEGGEFLPLLHLFWLLAPLLSVCQAMCFRVFTNMGGIPANRAIVAGYSCHS
jgi:hypothetical protein